MKIQFCPQCGTKIDEDARFCKNCGVSLSKFMQGINVDESEQIEKHIESNPTEIKNVYEGTIHKCPKCGTTLGAFISVCPSCGHEIRGNKAASSVQKLALKLEKISAKKMPEFKEKRSLLKMVFGKDFRGEDALEEARAEFEYQKKKEKASLIIHFPIPNSKEDILEFMILAASNIDVKQEMDDILTKAWVSKLEQVYQRAEITMKDHPSFIEVKEIYDRKKKEMHDKKKRGILGWTGGIIGWIFLVGLLASPILTVAIVVIVLIIVFVVWAKRRKKNKSDMYPESWTHIDL